MNGGLLLVYKIITRKLFLIHLVSCAAMARFKMMALISTLRKDLKTLLLKREIWQNTEFEL